MITVILDVTWISQQAPPFWPPSLAQKMVTPTNASASPLIQLTFLQPDNIHFTHKVSHFYTMSSRLLFSMTNILINHAHNILM